MNSDKSQLQFVNFLVPFYFFEKKEIEKENDSELKIIPQAIIIKSKKQIHISIDLELNDFENQFVLKIFGLGVFTYDTDDNENILQFLSLNGPAIVFPYVRSYVSSMTSQSGFDTVNLPTMNLSGYKEEILESLVDLDVQ